MKAFPVLMIALSLLTFVSCDQGKPVSDVSPSAPEPIPIPALDLEHGTIRFDLSPDQLKKDYIPYEIETLETESGTQVSGYVVWIHAKDWGMIESDFGKNQIQKLAIQAMESESGL